MSIHFYNVISTQKINTLLSVYLCTLLSIHDIIITVRGKTSNKKAKREGKKKRTIKIKGDFELCIKKTK